MNEAIAQNNPSPDAGCPETFRSLVREWLEEYHQISSAHFGDREAERIANTQRICAEQLSALIDAWDRELVEGKWHDEILKWGPAISQRMLGAKE